MLILSSGKICKNLTGDTIAADKFIESNKCLEDKYLQITCIKSSGNVKITSTGNTITISGDNMSDSDILGTELTAYVSPTSKTPTINSTDTLLEGITKLQGQISYMSSEMISYDNPSYPTIKSVLDKLLYVAPTVTISGGGNYEIGTVINTVNLTWSLNKNVTSQSLNVIGNIASDLRAYTLLNQNLTSNKTYTITVNDGTSSASSSTNVNFMYKRYWGTSTNQTLTNAQILALNSEFATSKTQNKTFDCTGGKYFYIIYPVSFGSATFKVGGLSFSDMNITTVTLTNAVGATVQVYVCRVNYIQTGNNISVEVI